MAGEICTAKVGQEAANILGRPSGRLVIGSSAIRRRREHRGSSRSKITDYGFAWVALGCRKMVACPLVACAQPRSAACVTTAPPTHFPPPPPSRGLGDLGLFGAAIRRCVRLSNSQNVRWGPSGPPPLAPKPQSEPLELGTGAPGGEGPRTKAPRRPHVRRLRPPLGALGGLIPRHGHEDKMGDTIDFTLQPQPRITATKSVQSLAATLPSIRSTDADSVAVSCIPVSSASLLAVYHRECFARCIPASCQSPAHRDKAAVAITEGDSTSNFGRSSGLPSNAHLSNVRRRPGPRQILTLCETPLTS